MKKIGGLSNSKGTSAISKHLYFDHLSKDDSQIRWNRWMEKILKLYFHFLALYELATTWSNLIL
jgi:hypothetical protein